MAFFHFNTTRKYTAALLSLFNNLEIQSTTQTGKIVSNKIPVQYSNKEKSIVLSQISFDKLMTNNQILPRGLLYFNGLSTNRIREKIKYNKIYNKKIGDKILKFQYSSIPYDFNYALIIQTRGMNDAMMVIEQVCSYFNPSYSFRLNETDLPDMEQTTIVLDLNDTSIEQSEMSDEFSMNVVTITFDFKLRGNIYPAIKQQETIELIQYFISTTYNGVDVNRVTSMAHDINNNEYINDYFININDIKIVDDLLICEYEAPCEKTIKISFEWYVNDELLNQNTNEILTNIKDGDIVKVRAYSDLVSSDFFEKKITKDSETLKIIIKDVKYDGKFLECIFEDENQYYSIYDFRWYIDGDYINKNNKIIEYNSKKNFSVGCVILEGNRISNKFIKKIYASKVNLSFEDNVNISDKMDLDEINNLKLTSKFDKVNENIKIEEK